MEIIFVEVFKKATELSLFTKLEIHKGKIYTVCIIDRRDINIIHLINKEWQY